MQLSVKLTEEGSQLVLIEVKSSELENDADDMLARSNEDVCTQILTSLDVFETDFAYLFVVLRNSEDPVKDRIFGKIAFNRTNFLDHHRKDLIRQYMVSILLPYCQFMFSMQFYKEERTKLLTLLEQKFGTAVSPSYENSNLNALKMREMKLIKIGKFCYQTFK